jgi:hypothetical protein
MLNNFVNFNFLFTKLSGIDPCEKHKNKFEAMAIYLVKQACENDKLGCVYLLREGNISDLKISSGKHTYVHKYFQIILIMYT